MALETEAQSAIAGAASSAELEEARVRYLGRKSELAQALRAVRDRETGMTLNGIRDRLETAVDARRGELERAGCHGSKASLSKLNSVVSTSRSSRIS